MLCWPRFSIKKRAGLYHPWFYTYCGKLTSPEQVDRYVRLRQTIWSSQASSSAGKRILDAGGGFGINALLMALLGAAEVHGLDIHRGMIGTYQAVSVAAAIQVPVFRCSGRRRLSALAVQLVRYRHLHRGHLALP